MTHEFDFNEKNWQWALDELISKTPAPPEGEPAPVFPALPEYVQERLNDVGNSYARQRETATEMDPDFKPIFEALRQIEDKTKLAAVLTAIDAARAK